MSREPSVHSGFTLLEVVVALAVLSMALMAIFKLNSGAVAMHAYTKRLTVATLLARSKMTDVEQELYDKGFNLDDEEKSGDFSDEGWKSFRWRARIIAPRTEGLSPEQLIGALFGIPTGGKGLSSLFGGGAPGASSAIPGASAGASGLSALGPMAGMMQGQIAQMTDSLGKSMREIRLNVSWRDGRNLESLELVSHIVALGPGSDRNGATNFAGGAAAVDPSVAAAAAAAQSVAPGSLNGIPRSPFGNRPLPTPFP